MPADSGIHSDTDNNPAHHNAFGIDRQRLLQMQQRFLQLNNLRLQRTRNSLSQRQGPVLDLLPLLFHCNHPGLPGYVSQATPTGLSGYQADKAAQREARRLARSFRYPALELGREEILGLYIMGSIGTIGQSRSSDLDIWVCYAPQLKLHALAELRQKCARISSWCRTLNLEVCFFAMDTEKFRRGETTPLSEESSGGSQHGLLLDEFYRSAVYLGGRLPLWWFVPQRQHCNYQACANELLQKRFLRSRDVLDFGQPQIPPQEYISAAIWQLYKGIYAPYKSLLKLLLLEAYAARHPHTSLLSSQFKQRLEDGSDDFNQLDPYLLVYHMVEDYLLQQGASERLELVRRCFYFKVDKRLSQQSSSTPPSWQQQQLRQLVDGWQWPNSQLQLLDDRKQWKTELVLRERQQLVSELLRSYRTLSGFVRSSHTQLRHIQDEISILGRKLYAAFERKAGKIEWINPDIAPDLSEPYLTLQQAGDGHHWDLYCRAPQAELRKAVKSGFSVLELIAWAYCNQLLSPQTQSWLRNADGDSYKLDTLHSALRQWLPLPLAAAEHAAFSQKPVAKSLLLVLNLQQPSRVDKLGQELEPDPFNFGEQRRCLVNDAHLLVHNSWNEVHAHSFAGCGLEAVISEYLRQLRTAAECAPQLTLFCREGDMAAQLQQRLQQLLPHLRNSLQQSPTASSARFVLENNGHYSCWQFQQRQLMLQQAQDEQQLWRHLGQPQSQLNAIHFDRQTLSRHPLAALTGLPTRAAIQVGYRVRQQRAEVYVLDEKGSLFFCHGEFYSEASLLRPLHLFLRNVIARQNLSTTSDGHFGVYPIEFYQLQQNHAGGRFSAERRHIVNDISDVRFFNIQVIVGVDPLEQLHYSIYCNQREFHQAEAGTDLFQQVADYIVSRRQLQQRYPCYITDLDLSACAERIAGARPVQISHYLQLKNQVEQRLNQAMIPADS